MNQGMYQTNNSLINNSTCAKRSMLTRYELIVCGGHVGGITQKNMLLVLLSDPIGVGG